MDKKRPATKAEQWFIDRIGKRVYRGATKCRCKSCLIVAHEGLVISDIDHATYLYLVSQEMGIKYHDEPIGNTII